jgi:predicted metal-dependent phosphotriesterase family hydrolase
MRKAGYTEEAIDKILVDNPAAALTFTEPMPA